MKQAIWILWPSFVVGGIAETIFFTLFDPQELQVFGVQHEFSRVAVYSVGFFLFWLLAACSSAFTCFMQHLSRASGPGPRRETGV
jgi:hypothetical protein